MSEQDEGARARAEEARLPTAAFEVINFTSAAAGDSDAERNTVFGSLVTGDADITGLVAYSIYKQNKHDWLVAFARAKGREPTEAESASYIIGESTPRRLAIYRHLANATLEGRGPDVQVAPGAPAPRASAAAPSAASNVLQWIVAALVAATLVFLVVRLGLPGG